MARSNTGRQGDAASGEKQRVAGRYQEQQGEVAGGRARRGTKQLKIMKSPERRKGQRGDDVALQTKQSRRKKAVRFANSC